MNGYDSPAIIDAFKRGARWQRQRGRISKRGRPPPTPARSYRRRPTKKARKNTSYKSTRRRRTGARPMADMSAGAVSNSYYSYRG